MVIKRQKPTLDTQKIKRRETKHTLQKIQNFTKKDSKWGGGKKNKKQNNKQETRELKNNQKTINKMALESPYLSIITLTIN